MVAPALTVRVSMSKNHKEQHILNLVKREWQANKSKASKNAEILIFLLCKFVKLSLLISSGVYIDFTQPCETHCKVFSYLQLKQRLIKGNLQQPATTPWRSNGQLNLLFYLTLVLLGRSPDLPFFEWRNTTTPLESFSTARL